MRRLKRKNLVFIKESQELMDILDRVVAKCQPAFGASVVVERFDLVLPKRWGGYEIPVRLQELSEVGIQNCSWSIVDLVTDDVIFDIACHFYADTKKKMEPVLGIALVSRCLKSRKSGILIYWKR